MSAKAATNYRQTSGYMGILSIACSAVRAKIGKLEAVATQWSRCFTYVRLADDR